MGTGKEKSKVTYTVKYPAYWKNKEGGILTVLILSIVKNKWSLCTTKVKLIEFELMELKGFILVHFEFLVQL